MSTTETVYDDKKQLVRRTTTVSDIVITKDYLEWEMTDCTKQIENLQRSIAFYAERIKFIEEDMFKV